MPRFTLDRMPKIIADQAWNYYGLVSESSNLKGGIVAYLTQEVLLPNGDTDAVSTAVGRLQEAAGDTEEQVQNGEGSFHLAELSGDNDYDFQTTLRSGDLNVIKLDGKLVGYVFHNNPICGAVMQALNGDPIQLKPPVVKSAVVIRSDNRLEGVWVRDCSVTAIAAAIQYAKENGFTADEKEFSDCLLRNGYNEYINKDGEVVAVEITDAHCE